MSGIDFDVAVQPPDADPALDALAGHPNVQQQLRRRSDMLSFVQARHNLRIRRRQRASCAAEEHRIRNLPGVYAPKVKVISGENVTGNRGCISTSWITAGESIVEVSADSAILVDVEDPDEEDWTARLACKLLEERNRGKSSRFADYISVLMEIRDASSSILHNDHILKFVSWYDYMTETVEGFRDNFARSYERHGKTLCRDESDWTWATWVAHSRAFAVPPSPGHQRQMMLVPLIDMFNHCSRAASDLIYDREDDIFRIVFAHNLEADQEILISYGGHGNDFLLPFYGFAVEDNLADQYHVHLRELLTMTSPSDATSERPRDWLHGIDELRLKTLSQLEVDLARSPWFAIDRRGPSQELLITLRVLEAQDDQLETECQNFSKTSDLERELRVWHVLDELLSKKLCRLATIGEQQPDAPDEIRLFIREKVAVLNECLSTLRWRTQISIKLGMFVTVLVPPHLDTLAFITALE